MATKFITLSLLLFIAATSIFSTCNKGGIGGCANTRYSFQIDETIHPDYDSIQIKDTFHLLVDTPSKLYDVSSGMMIDYSKTSNLGNVITLLQFTQENHEIGAINKFDLIVYKGKKNTSIDPISQQDVLFSEANGNYIFDMAVIPKDTGRYVLTISNAANVYRQNDPCTKAGFTINFESINQHFYFLNLWRPDLTLDEPGMKHVYYFKVY